MIRTISRISDRYYLPVTIPVVTMLLAASVATAARFAGIELEAKGGGHKIRSVDISDVTRLQSGSALSKPYFSARGTTSIALIDVVNEQRVKFASEHGVNDPAALVAAVRHSPMANLLISIAIEESRGDPVAVGSLGELGAWQVKPADWGLVPVDIHGQASQAEKIVQCLLNSAKGDKIKALAQYNGGTTPPDKSYRYAKRILKRAQHLHVAINFLPPSSNEFSKSLLVSPGNPRML